jgi:hypothetical protein
MVEIRVENATNDEPDSRWAMVISINPGAPLGGSVTQYFLGNFNGTHSSTGYPRVMIRSAWRGQVTGSTRTSFPLQVRR